MFEGWGAALAATAVVGGVVSAVSSSNAASAQENAANTAANTQTGMFNQIQANEAPWVGTGGQANNALAQFYGLPGQNGAASTPNYNQILSNLPGYQFQLTQGTQAVDRNLAAQGLLQSGAAGKELQQYGQGLAQSYAGQYTQGLQNLSQMGQAGAAGVATAGMNAANNISSSQIYAGNAAAQGSINTGNAITGALNNGVSAYGYSTGFPGQSTPYSSYVGNSSNNPMNSSFYDPTQVVPTPGYINSNPGLP